MFVIANYDALKESYCCLLSPRLTGLLPLPLDMEKEINNALFPSFKMQNYYSLFNQDLAPIVIKMAKHLKNKGPKDSAT